MLLNGAAGPDDGLWGLNAPSGFGMPEWRAAAAWGRVRERAMGGWKRRFLAKTQSAQRIGFVSRERGGLGDRGGFARKMATKSTKGTKAFCDLCAFCGQLSVGVGCWFMSPVALISSCASWPSW
jgi:hypothetical protein